MAADLNMRKLSEHFTYDEMTLSGTAVRKGIKNDPSPAELKNLQQLCTKILEPFRAKVGPLRVSSGYRSPALNKLIGGSPKSQHCLGLAADVTPLKMDLKKAYLCLVDSGIPFDQAIFEFGRWVHVSWSVKPRGQKLVAFKETGKTRYVTLTDYGTKNL